jgi:DNA mismatch repair ATPase MutS
MMTSEQGLSSPYLTSEPFLHFFVSPFLIICFRYYALSAACALFKYAEASLNIRFAAGSLRIRYVPVEGTMMIDPDTARNLELVGNMTHKKSSHSLFGYAYSSSKSCIS